MFYILLFVLLLIFLLVIAWWFWGYACACEPGSRKMVPVYTDTFGGCGCSWGWGIIFILFLIVLIGIFCSRANVLGYQNCETGC